MSTDNIGEPVVAEEAIAQVLAEAHRTAEAQGAPDEARVILHVAQSFAEELSSRDPRFDRVGFIQAATEDR